MVFQSGPALARDGWVKLKYTPVNNLKGSWMDIRAAHIVISFLLLGALPLLPGGAPLELKGEFGSLEDHSKMIDIPAEWGAPSGMVQDQEGDHVLVPFFSFGGYGMMIAGYDGFMEAPEPVLISNGTERILVEEMYTGRNILEGSRGTDVLLRDTEGVLYGVSIPPEPEGAVFLGPDNIIRSDVSGKMALADVTGDGVKDLLHLSSDGSSLELYEGPLPSRFGKAVMGLPLVMEDLVSGMDLDGDGVSEIVMWNHQGNRSGLLIYHGYTLSLMAFLYDDMRIGNITHGDVDGNGLDDLFLEHPEAPGGGEIRVLFGETVGFDTNITSDGWGLAGNGTFGFSGMERIILRDLDGDGKDDLLIGAPLADEGRGRLLFIHGGPFWDRRLTGRPLVADAELRGIDVTDSLGSGIYIADDLDGDILPDVIVPVGGKLALVRGERNSVPRGINNPGFEDEEGAELASAEMGSTIILRCTASGGSNSTVDTLRAIIFTQRKEGSTSTWIYLQETGPSTAVYSGRLLLGRSSVPGRSLGVVMNDRVFYNISGETGGGLLVKGVAGQEDPPFFLEGGEETSVQEDSELEMVIRAWDPETGSVNWSFDDLPAWLGVISQGYSHGSMYVTLGGIPDNGDVGWNNFTVVIEAGGLESSTYVQLYVFNRRPMIHQLSVARQAWEGSLYGSGFFFEEKGGGLSFSISSEGPVEDSWLSVFENGSVSGTPGNRHVGEWTVNLTIDDGNGGRDWFVWSITVINKDPVVTPPYLRYCVEHVPLTLDFRCPDEGDGMTFYALRRSSQPVDLDPVNGTVSLVPRHDAGEVHTFLVIELAVEDVHGGETDVTFSIEVNNTAPTFIVPELPDMLVAGERYGFDLDSNEEGEGAEYLISSTLPFISVDHGSSAEMFRDTGVIHVEPWNMDAGAHSLHISVTDGLSGTDLFWNFTVVGNSSFGDPSVNITLIKQGGGRMVLYVDLAPGGYEPVSLRIVVNGTGSLPDDAGTSFLERSPGDGYYTVDVSPFNGSSVRLNVLLEVGISGQWTRTVRGEWTFPLEGEDTGGTSGSREFLLIAAAVLLFSVMIMIPLLLFERTSFRIQSTFLRGQVKEESVLPLIHERPGIGFFELLSSSGVSRGDLITTITYLESRGMARAVEDGRKVRFWPMMGSFVDLPLLLGRTERRVVSMFLEKREMDLAEAVSVSGMKEVRVERAISMLLLKGVLERRTHRGRELYRIPSKMVRSVKRVLEGP